MNELEIKIKLCHKNASLPKKANPTDSGWDLTVVDIIHKSENIVFCDTGIQIEPPSGYYTQIVPRSSIYKTNFIQANSIGIIDSDYRGNLMIALRHLGSKDKMIAEANLLIGQRIAQLLLVKNIQASIVAIDELSNTIRGDGGFGSSGK